MFFQRSQSAAVDFGHGIRVTEVGTGQQLNVVRWNTPKGTVSPSHHHPEEQAGYVIAGRIQVTLGDETRVLGPGDAYLIPANMPHQFTLLEDAEVIDIFAPVRPLDLGAALAGGGKR